MKPTKTTIIADSLNKETIFSDILSDKTGMIDIEVLPFSVWVKQGYPPIDHTLELINCFNVIQKAKNEFRILNKAMIYPEFVKEFITFITELNEYQIPIDQLPITTDLDQEIKHIALIIKENLHIHPSLKTLCLNKKDLSNTLLYPTFHNDINSKECYDILLANSAKNYPLIKHRPNIIHLYRALNKRQEIEGLAQYLLDNGIALKDVLISLVNPDAYLKWIRLIFDRYHIPFVSSIDDHDLFIVLRYRKLMKLIKQPTSLNLIDCLNNDCFNESFKDLALYLKQFNISFDQCLSNFDHPLPKDQHIINKHDLERFNELITKASLQQQQLLPTLIKIATCDESVKAIASLAYDIMIDQDNDHRELSQLYLIKNFLENYLNDINSFLLLDQLLSELRNNEQPMTSNQLLVTSLTEAIGINRKYQFVLGADSSAYPQINYHNGILDEQYYARLIYPSKDLRYRFYLDQLESCFKYCDNLIISYAYGDFSGKSKKIAFELDTFIKRYSELTFCDWPLNENDDIPYDLHHLKPELSRKLFLNGNILNGSVSSFERYFNCPYQYFMQDGLKINSYDMNLNSAKLGTILHYIMQTIVNKYHKDYGNTSKGEVLVIIEEAFDPLKKIYLNHNDLIDIIKHNFAKMIIDQLKILAKIERNDDFVPFKTEYRFNQQITLDDITIDMTGIIDRIDVNDDQYRIIDYKSSDHNLSKKKVESGQQLQLLTYLWLIETKLAKDAEGAYYCNFKNNNTNVIPVKLNRNKNALEEFDASDWYESYHKEHQLKGWYFIPRSDTDKKFKHLEEFKMILHDNYQKLANDLLAGIIAPNPQKDACKYCEYLGICRYYQQANDDESEDSNDEVE